MAVEGELPVNPGRLRHVISVEQLVTGSPQYRADGSIDQAWGTYLSSVSASIEPLRGRELYAAQQHHAEATVRFRLRWRDGITPQMRIVHGGLYYPILWVPPVDRQGIEHDMELLTTQGVKDA